MRIFPPEQVPEGQKEVIGQWGFADERQSWSWDDSHAALIAAGGVSGSMNMSVNVYSNHECVKLFLNDAQISPPAAARACSVSSYIYHYIYIYYTCLDIYILL